MKALVNLEEIRIWSIIKDFKGVVPHLKAIFSYFQNINFLKVQAISDPNLFTELTNIKIKHFYQIFENYLEYRFLHFSYIKCIPKLARKVNIIPKNILWKAFNRLFSLYFVQQTCMWWFKTSYLRVWKAKFDFITLS